MKIESTFVNGVNPFKTPFVLKQKNVRELNEYVGPGRRFDPNSFAGRLRTHIKANPNCSSDELATAFRTTKKHIIDTLKSARMIDVYAIPNRPGKYFYRHLEEQDEV